MRPTALKTRADLHGAPQQGSDGAPAGLMGRLGVFLLGSCLCPWQPQGRTLSYSCCLLLSSKQNHWDLLCGLICLFLQSARWGNSLVWTGQTC